MSKLILTHEVTGLGAPGDVVDVKNGFRSQLPHPPGLRRGVDPWWREADRADQGRPRLRELATLEEDPGIQASSEATTVKLVRQGGPRGSPVRFP